MEVRRQEQRRASAHGTHASRDLSEEEKRRVAECVLCRHLVLLLLSLALCAHRCDTPPRLHRLRESWKQKKSSTFHASHPSRDLSVQERERVAVTRDQWHDRSSHPAASPAPSHMLHPSRDLSSEEKRAVRATRSSWEAAGPWQRIFSETRPSRGLTAEERQRIAQLRAEWQRMSDAERTKAVQSFRRDYARSSPGTGAAAAASEDDAGLLSPSSAGSSGSIFSPLVAALRRSSGSKQRGQARGVGKLSPRSLNSSPDAGTGAAKSGHRRAGTGSGGAGTDADADDVPKQRREGCCSCCIQQ